MGLPDLRDQQVSLVLPGLLDPLALLEIPARGDPLVRLACPALMELLDHLAPLLCCPSALARVVETRAQRSQPKKPRPQPSCPRLGWL